MAWQKKSVQPTPHLEFSRLLTLSVVGNIEDVLNFFNLKFRTVKVMTSVNR